MDRDKIYDMKVLCIMNSLSLDFASSSDHPKSFFDPLPLSKSISQKLLKYSFLKS